MVITSIVQCIKVTKEGNMGGEDIYIDLGDEVKIVDCDNNEFIGRGLSMELDENIDKICLLLGNRKRFTIDVNKIKDVRML